MTKLDPIIAVKDVEASANWYQRVFGFKNAHGGQHFAVLITVDNDIILCLHQWGEHGHPSLSDLTKSAGNGLLLYFRTTELEKIRARVEAESSSIVEEMHINENSLKKEFSFEDPNGYIITVTEFHQYEG